MDIDIEIHVLDAYFYNWQVWGFDLLELSNGINVSALLSLHWDSETDPKRRRIFFDVLFVRGFINMFRLWKEGRAIDKEAAEGTDIPPYEE